MVREGEYIYRVVNHAHYRGMRDEGERRVYMREYMRRKRAEKTR
jgi:hypothetical protein